LKLFPDDPGPFAGGVSNGYIVPSKNFAHRFEISDLIVIHPLRLLSDNVVMCFL